LEDLISAPKLPPVVSIRSDDEGFYNIVPDNRQIVYEITRHVIEACGSNDIGFVTGRDDLKDSLERRAGFEDAMKEAGFEIREDMIFHGNYWVDQGPQMADFFIRGDGTVPRAIICSNDYMGVALMDELTKRGFRIPEDVMLSGVDNTYPSYSHIPSLTTSEIPADTLARTAVECLEKIDRGETVDIYINVPGKLIIRESTGGTFERDLYDAFASLDILQKTYYDKALAFVTLTSDFEDALSYSDAIKLALERLSDMKLFRKCYLCRYRENDREVIGIYEKGECTVTDIGFDASLLLPRKYEAKDHGVRIFLPVFYKNEVHGYAILELDPDAEGFFDERLEFLLMVFGQTLTRLHLYEKVFEAQDVMELYVRDSLTGLYNRRGFENTVSAMFRDSDPDTLKIAVASIDMDDLKIINDRFGHAAGDEAIKAMARCINDSLSGNEFAARMGGDEFEAVLILDGPGRIGQFIRSLRTAVKEVGIIPGTECNLSASIGTCEVPDWNSLMESMNKADKAMYIEKKIKKPK
ncbi:MAG: diguanylate cyclase, partial [Clostridiales bacterium]|nr:diguanylate cyclase [Clostridiales bacterium]